MGASPYTEAFYECHRGGARSSAAVVVPMLIELFAPRSVIDVGCGIGTWLATFREHGVDDVGGVDGGWVEHAALEIPAERFLTADLTRPLRLDRTFDLVLSLEVAEHLPPECADTFVDTLTRLGPAIVFSAAIPLQGGLNHVNEQWPEYWVERFAARGYDVVDGLRQRIWTNPAVDWYYAQNALMFVQPQVLDRRPAVARARQTAVTPPLPLVHPRLWQSALGWFRALNAAIEDVSTAVPPGTLIAVADQAQCGAALAAGHPALPFPEREGVYWGPPADDAAAIAELQRVRERGAGVLVVAWPAFWWLTHYRKFHDHLRSSFRCLVDNDRTVIFDLRSAGGDGSATP
jgi:SAM-dependent methyltransferase